MVAWLLHGSPRAACAQTVGSTPFGAQERFFEEQLRPLIQPELRTPAASDRVQIDYGGVLRSQAFWYQDFGPAVPPPFSPVRKFQGSRSVSDFDFRPWLSASLDGVHYGYVRGQFDFLQYGAGDSYIRNSDWRGPFVDIGFYRLDLDEAVRRYGCVDVDSWSADLTVGRQFLFVGRGVAFALVTDGVSFDWGAGDWGGLAFGSRSIPHFDNIDRSVPGYDRSEREFWGTQIEYRALDHHKPYAYGVVQRDRSQESPEDPLQEFDYDSEYWGLGVRGETLFGPGECAVGIPNLQYFAEFILEHGRSFGVGATDHQDPIRSWAMDVGLIHYGTSRTQPRVLLEYARASGDPDRVSPQNTAIGNLSGTPDRGFLDFGFLNTGVSFAPLFANLEFVRVGGAFRPFEECCDWRMSDMELGSSFFAYWRPREDAGVSDVRADIPGDHFLGTELDFTATWRLSSDLYFLANYGIFWPNGDTFSVDHSRQFVGFNLTWLF